MRVRNHSCFALLLALAAVSGALSTAQSTSQSGSHATAARLPRAELALEYSYLRSNAPPGGCACFGLNGGSASFAWPIRPGASIALAGEITAAHASSITTASYDLNLTSYTAGLRYRLNLRESPWQPFGQALLGVAHSGGSLVSGQSPASANAGAAFAANLGGGLDLRANRRFSFRLVEADYLLTTFDNGSNNHQNNLRISAGVVLRF
jgi:peptidoglycan-associated lipoprotein